MHKNVTRVILLLVLCTQSLFSQSEDTKVYFGKTGKAATTAQAYYYREKQSDSPTHYKSFYVNGGSLYFDGNIVTASIDDEAMNVYNGLCVWYFRNGKKKYSKTFDATGIENGPATYYYESGKIWKEMEYAKGQIVDGRYTEYNEDGQVNRIFEEDFDNNNNDWDVYTSDKTSAKISNGSLEITSFIPAGAARYISIPSQSSEFALEAVINLEKLKEGSKAGLIFGFKDWENYNYFYITSTSFYIGTVYEGVNSTSADGMYSSDIKRKAPNTIKIICDGEKNFYSINGEIQYSHSRTKNFGNNIGFAVSGKTSVSIDKLIYKEIGYKSSSNSSSSSSSDLDIKSTGSGLIFSEKGYIITNYHVVDNANKIVVEQNNMGVTKSYNAIVVQKDIDNDLALLKITDEFKIAPIPYSFKEGGGVDVASTVFTIGYPHALSGMGKEAKFTDGKISSKTGYNNAINTYQTSIPVQPGNSGGPLFTEKAQLVGVINSAITNAENVSYAIKLNYVKNLIELLPETVEIPSSQSLSNASLEEKIKVISNYVVLIKIK
jgi:S1-C subfamily serine protease